MLQVGGRNNQGQHRATKTGVLSHDEILVWESYTYDHILMA
jgi:hypothetical protein